MLFFPLISHADFKVDIERCVPYEQQWIMKKIVKHESSGNPLAINVNNVPRQLGYKPKNKKEAEIIANELVNMGLSIDIGYTQINSAHLKKNGFLGKKDIKIKNMFDSCTNLLAGAIVYQSAYNQYGDVRKALSVYNTGDPKRGIRNGYVDKVLKN
jgi:type IV secretion system protein VirB1